MNAIAAPKSHRINQLEGITLTAIFQAFPTFAATVLLLKLAGSREIVGDPGGAAIFVAVMLPLLLLLPSTRESRIVLAASAGLFLVGLADDILHIKPYQKLIGQLLGAATVVWFGLVLPWTTSFPVNLLITLFWLVGITNALNMLDNMDGLAAGVAAIAALFLALNFQGSHHWLEAQMLVALAAALLGFLVYNHHPASIFMGDCGSMFVGFLLSTSVLLNQTGGRSRGIVPILAVPVLVLFVPIFDTTFVTVLRKLWGRKASQGGRDHTSHRLVALGLSEHGRPDAIYLRGRGWCSFDSRQPTAVDAKSCYCRHLHDRSRDRGCLSIGGKSLRPARCGARKA